MLSRASVFLLLCFISQAFAQNEITLPVLKKEIREEIRKKFVRDLGIEGELGEDREHSGRDVILAHTNPYSGLIEMYQCAYQHPPAATEDDAKTAAYRFLGKYGKWFGYDKNFLQNIEVVRTGDMGEGVQVLHFGIKGKTWKYAHIPLTGLTYIPEFYVVVEKGRVIWYKNKTLSHVYDLELLKSLVVKPSAEEKTLRAPLLKQDLELYEQGRGYFSIGKVSPEDIVSSELTVIHYKDGDELKVTLARLNIVKRATHPRFKWEIHTSAHTGKVLRVLQLYNL